MPDPTGYGRTVDRSRTPEVYVSIDVVSAVTRDAFRGLLAARSTTALAGLVVAYLPALRACRIDPIVALCQE